MKKGTSTLLRIGVAGGCKFASKPWRRNAHRSIDFEILKIILKLVLSRVQVQTFKSPFGKVHNAAGILPVLCYHSNDCFAFCSE